MRERVQGGPYLGRPSDRASLQSGTHAYADCLDGLLLRSGFLARADLDLDRRRLGGFRHLDSQDPVLDLGRDLVGLERIGQADLPVQVASLRTKEPFVSVW